MIVFGPIVSRRFGKSLGVDLSPSKKQCNFDCLYCELGGGKTLEKIDEVIDIDEVLLEIKNALCIHKEIDVLTITANGEPTLYPHLYELISKIKEILPPNIKSLILTNGSLLWEPNISKALNLFDIVKFSLDSINQKTFKKIDRPDKSISLDKILYGISEFSKTYKGELVCEILIIENLNDTIEEMEKVADFLREIKIARVDLGTLDRPPAYNIKPISSEKLNSLLVAFDGLCVSIPQRKESDPKIKTNYTKQDLLDLLKRRPLSQSEIMHMIEDESLLNLLIESGEIHKKEVANTIFYAI